MEFPPWADSALILTDKGVVGRRDMRPDGQQAKRQAQYAKRQAQYPQFNFELSAAPYR